jgi:chitinase
MSRPRLRAWFTAAVTAATITTTACGGAAAVSAPPGPPEPPEVPPAASPARWVAGYYVGYQRHLYPVEDIDFSLLTHIIVGRVVPTAAGGLVTSFDIDGVNGPAMARSVTARARAAGRPAILMVGGAGARSAFVAAASSANRAAFVDTLIATVDALGFNGLDIDWEPIRPEDEAPLLALFRALRSARPKLLLTMPVEWRSASYAAGSSPWLAEAATLIDRVNIMTYGMAGRWPGWLSWHSSALSGAAAQHPSSVESNVRAYLGDGVPAAKLGIGIGFYGTCWRGVTGPRQPATSAAVVAADNTMSHARIMAAYHTGDAYRWDDEAAAPYLSFDAPTGPAGCTYVSYEDSRSIAEKAEFARAEGLGGAIIWTVAQGHAANAAPAERDVLLRTAWTAFSR